MTIYVFQTLVYIVILYATGVRGIGSGEYVMHGRVEARRQGVIRFSQDRLS